MATSFTNISTWGAGGFSLIQQIRSTSGLPYDSNNAPAQGASVNMADLDGAVELELDFGEAEVIELDADNGVIGAIVLPNENLPRVRMGWRQFQGSFMNDIEGLTAEDAQSTYNLYHIGAKGVTLTDQFMMFHRPGPSLEAGEEGNGFETLILPLLQLTFDGFDNWGTGNTKSLYTVSGTVNRVTQFPWGSSLVEGTHGTTKVAGWLMWSQHIPTFQVYKDDGAATTVTNGKTLAENNQVIAWSDITGSPATLATGLSSNNFTITAQSADELHLFMSERTR